MKLTINTIGAYEVNSFYHCEGKLVCNGCDTEILESEQVFAINYFLTDHPIGFVYHTHNSQDCLKPWIVNNLEPASRV